MHTLSLLQTSHVKSAGYQDPEVIHRLGEFWDSALKYFPKWQILTETEKKLFQFSGEFKGISSGITDPERRHKKPKCFLNHLHEALVICTHLPPPEIIRFHKSPCDCWIDHDKVEGFFWQCWNKGYICNLHIRLMVTQTLVISHSANQGKLGKRNYATPQGTQMTAKEHP